MQALAWNPLGLSHDHSNELRCRRACKIIHGRLGAMESFGQLLPHASDEELGCLASSVDADSSSIETCHQATRVAPCIFQWDPLAVADEPAKAARRRRAAEASRGRVTWLAAISLHLPPVSEEVLGCLSASAHLSDESMKMDEAVAAKDPGQELSEMLIEELGQQSQHPNEAVLDTPLVPSRQAASPKAQVIKSLDVARAMPAGAKVVVAKAVGKDHRAMQPRPVASAVRSLARARKNAARSPISLLSPDGKVPVLPTAKATLEVAAPAATGRKLTKVVQPRCLNDELEVFCLPQSGLKRPVACGEVSSPTKRVAKEEVEQEVAWPEDGSAQCDGCQRVTYGCEPYGISGALLCASCSKMKCPAVFALARECMKLQSGLSR